MFLASTTKSTYPCKVKLHSWRSPPRQDLSYSAMRFEFILLFFFSLCIFCGRVPRCLLLTDGGLSGAAGCGGSPSIVQSRKDISLNKRRAHAPISVPVLSLFIHLFLHFREKTTAWFLSSDAKHRHYALEPVTPTAAILPAISSSCDICMYNREMAENTEADLDGTVAHNCCMNNRRMAGSSALKLFWLRLFILNIHFWKWI